MNRTYFLKHLKKYDCVFLREGAKHSVFLNVKNNKQSTVPRHSELSDLLCKKICKQLDIPEI
jgi:mRNA interferase HicA